MNGINLPPEDLEPEFTDSTKHMLELVKRIMKTNERLLTIVEIIGATPQIIKTRVKSDNED